MDLKIKPLQEKVKTEWGQCEEMKEHIVPSFPESILLVGPSGSGKTLCGMNLIKRFWKNNKGEPFFKPENIFLISFTAKTDKSFESLDIPEENKIDENMIEFLEKKFNERKDEVGDDDNNDVEPWLFILEDVSGNNKLINSKHFQWLFTQIRHLCCSILCCAHKWSAIPRLCRLSAMNIIIYPSQTTEKQKIWDDLGPSGITKKKFYELIDTSWRKTPDCQYPFLYVCMKVSPDKRFRKTFSTMLKWC